MRKFLLTGQIGAGKSTVLNLFRGSNTLLLSADEIVKELYAKDADLVSQIEHNLNADLRTPAGALDKAKLANLIFNDSLKLQKVEKLVHPRVNAYVDQTIAESPAEFCVYENAVVRNPSTFDLFDGVIFVMAPIEIRKARLLARGLDEADIESRMRNQSDLHSFSIPVYSIENSGTTEDLEREVQLLKVQLGMVQND